MKWSEDDIDLLERYALSSLSPEEKQAVERKLAEDKEYAAEAATVARGLAGIKALGKEEERKKLKAVWQEVQSEPSYKKADRSRAFLWRMAASILLLLSVGTFFLLQDGTTKEEKLFREAFVPFPALPKTRTDVPELLSGMEMYRKKNYAAAQESFQAQLKPDQDQSLLKVYLANCLLAQGQNKKAIDLLKPLSQRSTKGPDVHARWYLALALLRKGASGEAQSLFQQISEESGPYSIQATSILTKLKDS